MKDQLRFDTTNANTIADSDNVGAFVRGSNGSLIDEVTINTVKRLAVDATLKDGAGNVLTSTGGALDINIKSPVVVNVDLDGVYSLTNLLADSAGAIFSVRAATLDITTQTARVTAGYLGNVLAADIAKVNALDTNAFIKALNTVSGDMQQLTVDNVSGGLNVNIATGTVTVSDAALANIAITSKAKILAVAGTAETAVTAALANRKYLSIYNVDNQKIYIGGADVSVANGFPVSPGSYLDLRAGAASPVYFVGSATKTPEIRTLQLS